MLVGTNFKLILVLRALYICFKLYNKHNYEVQNTKKSVLKYAKR